MGQHKGVFGGEGAVLYPDCGISMILCISKTYRSVYTPPTEVNCTVCKFKVK